MRWCYQAAPVMVLLVGCLPAPRGLAGVQAPQEVIHPNQGRPPSMQLRAVLSGGGSLTGGAAQTRLSTTAQFSKWYATEFGLIATGLYDGALQSLGKAQDSSFLFGVLPYIAPTFYAGPIHIQLMLFGIGGGGPEGPAGATGYAGLSVGYHWAWGSVFTGASIFGTFGCCDGEYNARIIQAPVGLTMDLPTGWKSADLSLGAEAIYENLAASFRTERDELQTLTLLFHLIFSTR